MPFDEQVLKLDTEQVLRSICEAIRSQVHQVLRRKGAVVGVSGGVDSSVCAALCVRALGKEHAVALSMPDRDSSKDSLRLAEQLAANLGMRWLVEDIEPVHVGAGCGRRQTEAIRTIFPDYGEGWKCRITIPSILLGDRLNLSRLEVETPSGERRSERMGPAAYLQLVAATNFKQRTRKMIEYYHADRLNYAVCGTPNRLEYDQGFFVKGGDGSADFKPIAHLYKTQVYALARALGIPDEICRRPPTTDTFSLPQSQEEFYFSLPYEKMDLCLYGLNHRIAASEVAPAIGLTSEQVERVYRDIESKRRATLSHHRTPLLAEPVPEISALLDRDTNPGN